jgi:hypothetical protein
MADTKISALTGSTTPLAGTEVLPIVQSGVTKQVSVADLTAGRAVSALTFTSTVATGTAPFTVSSTTNVPNLNASSLSGATFASPGAIGSGTPSTGAFTTLSLSGTGYAFTATGTSTLRKAGSIGNTGGGLDWGVESSAGGALFTYAAAYTGNIGTSGNTDFNLCANGNVVATATTAGNLSVRNGNFVPATAAKGIDFTANTPASGMTSQLLNAYEEGTWTPTISGTTTAGVGTYVSQVGNYTRIGRQVTVYGRVQISAHTGTGNMLITNLPFGLSGDYACGSIYASNLALNASYYPVIFMSGAGSTSISINQVATGTGADAVVPMDTSCDLIFSITYFA